MSAWEDSDASAVDLTNITNISCGKYACVARQVGGSALARGSSSCGGDAPAVDLIILAAEDLLA